MGTGCTEERRGEARRVVGGDGQTRTSPVTDARALSSEPTQASDGSTAHTGSTSHVPPPPRASERRLRFIFPFDDTVHLTSYLTPSPPSPHFAPRSRIAASLASWESWPPSALSRPSLLDTDDQRCPSAAGSSDGSSVRPPDPSSMCSITRSAPLLSATDGPPSSRSSPRVT
ncbi:hypothetical protein BD414DRAFT_301631 [Trametes punicea]|nr:hypothetical protein BD414DRAFT_301631 [Trametes punicea]